VPYFPESYFDNDFVAQLLRELGADEEWARGMERDPIRTWARLAEAEPDLVGALRAHPAWESIMGEAEKALILEILDEEYDFFDSEREYGEALRLL